MTEGPPAAAERSRGESPALEVRDLCVGYGATTVLDAVDLTVERGELVGLVGPNGAGKTTLLHAITGVLDPERGSVAVLGADVGTLSSAALSRRVAVVPQETTRSFDFSVRQLVAMGRHPHRSRFEAPDEQDRALVEDALERTATGHLADRSIDAVSGGERQRVLLARALAQDAPVLVLDEPTSDLDVNHAVETTTVVREVVDEGRAAIAAIHDLELAARFCDRLLVLADGRIAAAGPPEDVLTGERVGEVFDARAVVESDPLTDSVTVRAFPERAPDAASSGVADRRIHVVGTGELAGRTLGTLGAAGADLSAGPLPDGDRAASVAEAFDAQVVTAPPFESVDEAALRRARSLAGEADALVLVAGAVEQVAGAWAPVRTVADTVVAVDTSADGTDAVGDVTLESAVDSTETAPLDDLPAAVAAAIDDSSEPGDGRSTSATADAPGNGAERRVDSGVSDSAGGSSE